DAGKYTFPVRGLDPQRNYRLRFRDGSSADSVRSGRELMRDGLALTLPVPESSELVSIEAM
ncbi:GH36 C-terminal domain-containing protein, partial [Rudaea sp.]|uniref:GH36 C-terminal domain-containing protein n=1 Tax=Rudaea sp. TaxID=2136325 RepID=UPI002ED4A68C